MEKYEFSEDAAGLFLNGEFVAPFYPKVLSRKHILDENGEMLQNEYEVSVVFPGKKPLESFRFKQLSDIRYSFYWDECCDAKLTGKQKKQLLIYLQQSLSDIPREDYVILSKLGFSKGKNKVYVYDANTVFIPHNTPVKYKIRDGLPDFTSSLRCDVKECLEYVHQLMEFYPGVTDMLMSIAMFSVIKPVFLQMNYSPNFFVNIYGESGSFKTTFAKLFFAQSEDQVLSFSRNRRSDIDKVSNRYLGHSIVIDDYHPESKKSDKERQMGILDVVSRKSDSCEGALAIVTSEYLDGCYSLQDRMVQIRVDKIIRGSGSNTNMRQFSEKLTKFQRYSFKIADFLFYFAQRVYKTIDETKVFVQSQLENCQNSISGYRIDWHLNFLKVTLNIFEKVFPEVEKWGIDVQLSNSFSKISEKQKHHMEIVKRLEKPDWALEVFEMLNDSKFPRDYDIHKEYIYKQEVIVDNNIVYITETELQNRMNHLLEGRVRVKDIIKDLDAKQILLTDNSASKTKKVYGKRFYHIDRRALELYVERNRRGF